MAKQCAELSISETVLYDTQNDANPIQFSKLPDEKIGKHVFLFIIHTRATQTLVNS